MSSANQRQVGGQHYGLRDHQHWDVIDDNGIGYLEGVATKYIARWWKPGGGGLKSLEKALHYVDKLIENVQTKGRRPRGTVSTEELAQFCREEDMLPVEAIITGCLLQWSDVRHLLNARESLQLVINNYKNLETEHARYQHPNEDTPSQA